MFPFKLKTHTSVLVRLQGIRKLEDFRKFRRLLLKVIKGMKVIRGDYSHSSTLMFKIVSVNTQWHDDLTGSPRNRQYHPTAYCILSHYNKDPRNYFKNNRKKLFADLHKEPNFGLQKKVLAPFLIADGFIIHKFIICLLQTFKSHAYSGEKENKFKKHQEYKHTFFNADNDFVDPDRLHIQHRH